MHIVAVFAILAGLLGHFHPEVGLPEKTTRFQVSPNIHQTIRVDLKPKSEFKYENITKQQYDYSCGSAALATLMNSYLGENFSETQVIRGLMKYGDKEQIAKKRAFSLWDMQKFLAVLGHQSGGYKASMDDLTNPSHWPCIVPIKVFGYHHFVILKGVHDNHVFIADPWMGHISYPIDTFEEAWQKIMFIANPKDGKGITALKLRNKDLRYIDADLELTLALWDTPLNPDVQTWQVRESTGLNNWFKYKH